MHPKPLSLSLSLSLWHCLIDERLSNTRRQLDLCTSNATYQSAIMPSGIQETGTSVSLHARGHRLNRNISSPLCCNPLSSSHLTPSLLTFLSFLREPDFRALFGRPRVLKIMRFQEFPPVPFLEVIAEETSLLVGKGAAGTPRVFPLSFFL